MRLKHTWIPFVLSLFVVLPVRFHQINVQIADESSFFNTRNSAYALLGIILVFVLPIISMSLISKNVPKNIKFRKNIISGVLSAALGAMMIYQGCKLMPYGFDSDLKGGEQLRVMILGLLTILAGIVFFVMMVCCLTGKSLFISAPVLILIPTVWAGVRLVFIYIYHTTAASSVNKTFDILSLVFMVLFLFVQAKMVTNMSEKNLTQRAFAFGMPAILLILLYNLPLVFFESIKISSVLVNDNIFYLIDLVLGLYILTSLVDTTVALEKIEAYQHERLENEE